MTGPPPLTSVNKHSINVNWWASRGRAGCVYRERALGEAAEKCMTSEWSGVEREL